jgi:hypothetical protein
MIRKEAIMVQFVVLSQYLVRETKETARNISSLRKISVIFDTLTQHLLNINQMCRVDQPQN